MRPLMLQINCVKQMHAWLAFCTRFNELAKHGSQGESSVFESDVAVRSESVHVHASPPDICALAFWPKDLLDPVLQGLQLLRVGSPLRAMSAIQFRASYPHLHLGHLRWALQQLSANAACFSDAEPTQLTEAMLKNCETALGRRALLWCAIMQSMPRRFSALGDVLALHLDFENIPSDPYRVWLPKAAWTKLLEMGTGAEGVRIEASTVVSAQAIEHFPRLHRADDGYSAADHAVELPYSVNSLENVGRVRA